jgi:hypothetical protein
MINSLRAGAVLALAALTVAATGCSSSGGQPAASSSAAAPSTCKASTGAKSHGPTRQAVLKAFRVFFNSDTKVCQAQAVLQHGAVFHQTLIDQGKTAYAKSTSAKVTSVGKTSANVVAVKFTITSGSIHFPYHGYAVRENGTWKISAKTLCGLLTVEGDAPAACKKASITALPH